MSTEYRRGIPGTAHVEAATRLGLLWRGSDEWLHRFRNQNGQIEVWYFEDPNETPDWEAPDFAIEDLDFRPICPDGTPVDWEVLDQEVARGIHAGNARNAPLSNALANFATVLDAVAERRVAERMRGQAPAPTVTSVPAQPEPCRFADVRPDRHGWRWWRIVGGPDAGVIGARFEAMNVGLWRWLAMADGAVPTGSLIGGQSWARIDSIWNPRTIIPTDEQGNPVSWESIGQGQQTTQTVTGRDVEEDRPRLAERRIPAFMPSPSMAAAVEASRLNEQRLAENPELWREAQRQAASSPRTADAIYQELRRTPPINVAAFRELQEFTSRAITQVVLGQPHAVETDGDTTYVNLRNSDGLSLHDSLKQQPLPRFTADELDDVDHSATTTQDSATLKRGKLPTVEAIGKYREVMAKRNGTVAEAVKASGIDCEVAQYVLERWAGGLSDREAEIICDEAYGAVSFTRADIAKRLSHWFAIIRPTLDTSEPADTAAQRQRAEAAERKARMAALQAQLAKERAARIAEPEPELSRFALLEVDEAADPSKSIEAWKAQRAANERRARNTVRPVTVTSPPPAPKRKPFEVVDAQADGLSGGAAFAVLLSRAMNQNC